VRVAFRFAIPTALESKLDDHTAWILIFSARDARLPYRATFDLGRGPTPVPKIEGRR
jgi:hypothetical protein